MCDSFYNFLRDKYKDTQYEVQYYRNALNPDEVRYMVYMNTTKGQFTLWNGARLRFDHEGKRACKIMASVEALIKKAFLDDNYILT